MEDSKKTYQGTYQYKKPYRFMGKEYSDSRSLAEAFIDNWDIATSVFRRGSMEGFWEEYVQDADKQLIDLSYDYFHWPFHKEWYEYDVYPEGIEDALFQRSLHYIEPALNGIPFVRAEDNEAKVYSFEEFGDWLLSLAAGGKWKVQWIYDEFDADNMNRSLLENAARYSVFSAYVPETKEAETKFYRADDAQKCRFLKELALRLQGKECFWYNNAFYTSMEELAPVVKEQLDKGVGVELFRDLFDSDEYSASFDSRSAKADGGKFLEKLSELKERWHKLKNLLPYDEPEQMTMEYTTYGSLLNQFSMKNAEVKSFLEMNIAAIAAKISLIQKELKYNQALAAVATGAVDAGLMRQEDMEQILSLKTVGDKIESLQLYLENEQAYMGRLEHALACFTEKRLASGWSEADKEGKILLLALGWQQLPAKALFEEINKAWQMDKDVSVLAGASMVLISVLRKGLFGGWDRTSREGASAYLQCLELIDCVSGLCIGTRLEEKWNRTCEIVRADSLGSLEQALSAFSEKYQKEEESVINIVKKSGCFEGISYDGEEKVSIICSEPSAGDKYFEVAEVIKNRHCHITSFYLSEYRQNIERLDRRLSAIKETGCRHGKLLEDIAEHRWLIEDIKNAEDTLKKSFKSSDPLMELLEDSMLAIDKEYEENEQRRRKEEEEKRKLSLEAEERKKEKNLIRRIFFK